MPSKKLLISSLIAISACVCMVPVSHAGVAKSDSYGVTTKKQGLNLPNLFGNKASTDSYGVTSSGSRKLNPLQWDATKNITRSFTQTSSTDSAGVTTSGTRKLFPNRPRPIKAIGEALSRSSGKAVSYRKPQRTNNWGLVR